MLDWSQLSLSTTVEVSKALNSFVSWKEVAEQGGEAQINASLETKAARRNYSH